MIRSSSPVRKRAAHTTLLKNNSAKAAIFLFSVLVLWASQVSAQFRRLNEEELAPVGSIITQAIREGKTPGAVIAIGDGNGILYRGAFGNREIEPERMPMTDGTVFDLASLTKVIATTTAIMQLIEEGKLGLDSPVSKYWPAFGAHGKRKITIRQLLTHYSGLRADLRLRPKWKGYKTAMEKIIAEKPLFPPGRVYLYSDINFEVLGELVRRVSGQPLEVYSKHRIFDPLGMKNTFFRPSPSLRDRIAPTQYRSRKIMCGEVHDPICYLMGGVAGHAGLFSTADDLAIFSQMLLNKGSFHGVKILRPETVELMTSPQSPPDMPKLRGLGWDIDAPFCSNREDFHTGAYGHLGYTGTALWIDPVSGTFIVLLTNRVHPDGNGDVKELRSDVKSFVSGLLGRLPAGPAISNLHHEIPGTKAQKKRKLSRS